MRTIAIIQARMGSTRLPGKVLRTLGGMSVLERICRSAMSASALDGVLVATSTAIADDEIAVHCSRTGVPCFRGSEEDVLERLQGASEESAADVVVRITGDCPLYDGGLLQEMLVDFHTVNRHEVTVDYMSNTLRRTYPRGLDTEIMTRHTLDLAAAGAVNQYQREHVTPYIYQNPQTFRLRNFEDVVDRSAHRWTLDTEEDWQFMTAVAEGLSGTETWTRALILDVLNANPEIAGINRHVQQKTH